MATSRLVSMLLMLQVKGRVTAQALADEFNVSIRTVYRDIDQLSAAGVPVYADRGPGGGFALLDGYRAKLTGITRAEAETLSIAGLTGAASDLGLSEQLRAAQLKLVTALPDAAPDTSRIGSRLHIDPVGWYQRPSPTPWLTMLAGAVWEQKRISMQYRTWNASGENEGVRVRDPLGLVLKGGEWYLVTRVRTQLRTYRVSSIAQLTVHDETFERPEDFDLRDEWTAAVASFETSLLKHTARLRLSPEGMTRLHRLGAAAVEQAQIAPPSEQDGWQEVILPVEQLGYAAEQLLGLAGHVEVLDPPELRERLRKLGEQIATLNAS
ncbi:helix-turn-helix transcriptional regulator [Paraburkholderia terrae]|uniref:Transcriptional regulator n=1 Tax=Paraburkholderia terrae TaxID=311230 RepID=A0A2I8EU39_9BURK|nr:YafY family protein [Paraburkholderia terrae]AUT63117.1 YafY family transcriptional regulator [Paraburkholderia terrae]BCZ80097.1 transcriptional regulator [Paraburkholderia terrae]BDC41435.1 transcriptional regulator [Paraburkholderia terrae]